MVNITKRDDAARTVTPYERSPASIIDRIFDDAFLDPFNTMLPSLFGGRRLASANSFFPKVDVSETDQEIKVIANVPGIDPQKINIEVGDDYLSLTGTIEKESKDDENGKIYRYEREYGEFRREFALPARVDTEHITAKAKNGVLTITLPKVEVEKKQKVTVEVE